MQHMSVACEVLMPDKFKVVKDEQPSKANLKVLTFDASREDKSSEVRDLQSLNIPYILADRDTSRFDKSTSRRYMQ